MLSLKQDIAHLVVIDYFRKDNKMDIIDIEILEDGTIKFNTDKISDKNHASADDFLDEIENLLGGKRETENKKKHNHHHHKHDHHHKH